MPMDKMLRLNTSSPQLRAVAGLAAAIGLLVLLPSLAPRSLAASGTDAAGSPLRGPPGAPEARTADTAHLLSHGLQGILGHSASPERIARLEDSLRRIFVALPKAGDGFVNQAAASYALHRFFHGLNAWTFKELTPGGSPDGDSPSSVSKSRVPDVISDVLDTGMSNKRIGLRDLALLAATVEDLVLGENIDVLLLAYKAYNLSIIEPLNIEQQRSVLQVYGARLLVHDDVNIKEQATAAEIQAVIDKARQTNPILEDTLLWVDDLVQTITMQDRTSGNPFAASERQGSWNFAAMARLAEKILAGIGRTQNSDCAIMKRELLELEEQGHEDGSITLDVFHKQHLSAIGVPEDQVADYLKFLSSLDRKNPKQPRAIVANYVYASAMCLVTPGVLKLCCINECNALMDGLEEKFARPSASPELVAQAVGTLESNNVAFNRTLPSSLLRSLDRIAARHGGQVPLHSKAFAHWMHRAFPAECPNPNVAGSLHAPWVGEAYVQSMDATTGFMSSKTPKLHAYDAVNTTDDFDEESDNEEELVAEFATSKKDRNAGVLRVALRVFALFAIVAASGFGFMKHARDMFEALGRNSAKKDDEVYC